MDSGIGDPTRASDGPPRGWSGFSVNQWVALAAMGGLLLAIGAAFALILRSGGIGPADVQATAGAGAGVPTPGAPRDAVPTAEGLYWPPNPQPLATPNAPGSLLWWDARFAFRRAVLLDVVAAQSPAGTWARLILDAESAQREDKMRDDAADVRLLVWDGQQWWEIPRRVGPLPGTTGWELVFQLQGTAPVSPDQVRRHVYYVYYGHPLAGSPPTVENAPERDPLLLELADQEAVEWGPEVLWKAGATAAQTLVSPDGRIVIQCHPGALREDTRVRLRMVPLSERSGQGSLPDFELHADPPPGSPGPDNVVRWDPPLAVTINWAGLEIDPGYLETWAHFAYDTSKGVWYSVPVEFDAEQGVIRFTTDQL
jgi:hypothetical protein